MKENQVAAIVAALLAIANADHEFISSVFGIVAIWLLIPRKSSQKKSA